MNIFYSEPQVGNLEYKLHLKDFTENKLQRYTSQLRYRLLEGQGEAFYVIGISDKGEVIGIPELEIKETISKFYLICYHTRCKVDIIMNCIFKDCKFLIFKITSLFDVGELPFLI